MINRITRIASLVLAFGFFISSCSSLQSSQKAFNPSADLTKQELQQQVTSVNKQIKEEGPTQGLLFTKGNLLTKLAQKQTDPKKRAPIYKQAQQSLEQAASLARNEADNEEVKELLKVTWSNEHNQGVQVMQRDSSSTPNYEQAAAHFDNATTIIPDSVISYKMGAQALYKNQQPQQAIEVLQDARQNIQNVPTLLLEQLAFLYLENNQPKKAVGIYEQAESFSDQNLNLLHGLSNAYIKAANHEKAIELLQQLIDQKPESASYGQSLALELYFSATKKLDHLNTTSQKLLISNPTFAAADSLFSQAEKQFQRTLKYNTNNQDLILGFARFYQNSASKYQRLLPLTEQETKNQLEKKIKRYLTDSIPLFEQLVGQYPDQKDIWQNLYQAYAYLGMDQKAKHAKSNL